MTVFSRSGSREANLQGFGGQIASFVRTSDSGVRSVDRAGLVQYFLSEFEGAIAQLADATERDAVRATSNLQARADQIASAISAAYTGLAQRSDYPAGQAAGGNEARVSQMLGLRNQIESNVREIEAEFGRRIDALRSGTLTFIADKGLGTLLTIDPDRVVDSRFYLTTFVSDWGEESAPSPITELLEVDQNDEVVVTRQTVPQGRFIQKWRIYRTNTGTDTAEFQLVEELLIGSTSYTDTVKSVGLGETLPTTNWLEPPYRADGQSSATPKPPTGANPFLRGLVGMPNGILAGFFDNTVAFSDPYHPYAWVPQYQVILDFPVVGLGVFGQTLFAGTTGSPYFISGSDSASMSAQKLDTNQSCVSRRSITAVQGGVVYASPDGLCLASSSGVQLMTAGLYTREDWQLLNPASMFTAETDGVVYIFYNNGTPGALALDVVNRKLGKLDIRASALHYDRLNDTLYYADGTGIFGAFRALTYRTARWRSAKTPVNSHTPLAWVQIDSDYEAPVTFRWYGDNALRHTEVLTSRTPARLPPGRWRDTEIEIESAARVTRVMVTSTTQELKQL